jgi:hypothetical protein
MSTERRLSVNAKAKDEGSLSRQQVSYVEIYCEKIQDLLNPKSDNLKITETTGEGVTLQDATGGRWSRSANKGVLALKRSSLDGLLGLCWCGSIPSSAFSCPYTPFYMAPFKEPTLMLTSPSVPLTPPAVYVSTPAHMRAVLQEGQKNRATSATLMNAGSSRSHALLIVNVTKKEGGKTRKAKLGEHQLPCFPPPE